MSATLTALWIVTIGGGCVAAYVVARAIGDWMDGKKKGRTVK